MRSCLLALPLAGVIAASACDRAVPTSPFAGTVTLAETAPGTSQSPINIRSDRVTFVGPRELPALEFRYGRHVALEVVNTGSPDEDATVRADLVRGANVLRVGGRRYELLQFHFHTPSEHLLNGKRYPLEMHLVHRGDDGELLVVGVLIHQGDEKHWPLERIFRRLPRDEQDRVRVEDFNLLRLLPDRTVSVRYSGSLTTPPFSEPVAWVVLKEAIEMSREQIDEFRALFPEGDAREAQPLHGRRVVTDAARIPFGDDS